MTKTQNVQGVIQVTPNFATTTTTVYHSQGTFARLVGGIGLKGEPLGTFQLEGVVERTRNQALKSPIAMIHKTNPLTGQSRASAHPLILILLISNSHSLMKCNFLLTSLT